MKTLANKLFDVPGFDIIVPEFQPRLVAEKEKERRKAKNRGAKERLKELGLSVNESDIESSSSNEEEVGELVSSAFHSNNPPRPLEREMDVDKATISDSGHRDTILAISPPEFKPYFLGRELPNAKNFVEVCGSIYPLWATTTYELFSLGDG